MKRRNFIKNTGAVLAAASMPVVAKTPKLTPRANRIGVSTYSFWGFNGPKENFPIETCIEKAAKMGFDGVELLLYQMESEENAYLQKIKKLAFHAGLDLMGFSTHQGFVFTDPAKRQSEIDKTINQIELAYKLGIPTMRINTGRWNTTKSFDDLMANKGIEPVIPGVSEDQGFQWVIDAIGACVEKASQCGVVLGLENHWGLGLTANGVLRIVNAINSPWLRVTTDTGNFLENRYSQIKQLAPYTSLIQAKTYFGGGKWYTLETDFKEIANIFREANYKGYISLEFEGKENPDTAIPKSLAELRAAFS